MRYPLTRRRERELIRKTDRLMRRILQLDDLLCRDSLLDKERASALKEQIRRRQCELEALYRELDLVRER